MDINNKFTKKGIYVLIFQILVMICIFINIISNFLKLDFWIYFSIIGFPIYTFFAIYFGRKIIKKEVLAYSVFFASLWLLSSLIFIIPYYFGEKYFWVTLVIILCFFIAFKIIFRKNTTEGIVISSDSKETIVKLDYDLLTQVKPGIYIVKDKKKRKKNSKVNVLIKKGFFRVKADSILN